MQILITDNSYFAKGVLQGYGFALLVFECRWALSIPIFRLYQAL